mgnify:CR=1 FL=1
MLKPGTYTGFYPLGSRESFRTRTEARLLTVASTSFYPLGSRESFRTHGEHLYYAGDRFLSAWVAGVVQNEIDNVPRHFEGFYPLGSRESFRTTPFGPDGGRDIIVSIRLGRGSRSEPTASGGALTRGNAGLVHTRPAQSSPQPYQPALPASSPLARRHTHPTAETPARAQSHQTPQNRTGPARAPEPGRSARSAPSTSHAPGPAGPGLQPQVLSHRPRRPSTSPYRARARREASDTLRPCPRRAATSRMARIAAS